MSDARSERAERRRLRRSVTAVSLLTVLARVAALPREIVAAAFFGVSSTMSAFTIAYQLTALARQFFADTAVAAAVIPGFARLEEAHGRERAWSAVSSFTTLLLLVLVPLCLLGMLAAPLVVELVTGPHFRERELAILLLRILLPSIVMLGLLGVIVALLHSFGKFAVPALAPLAANITIVIVALAVIPQLSDDARIVGYALATVTGFAVNLLVPIPWLRGHGGSLRLGRHLRDPAVVAMASAMLPIVASLVLLNVTQLVGTYFASLVATGDEISGPAVLDRARRIYMLPQGLFALAVSAVFFPTLARHMARGDSTAFRDTFAHGLRQLMVLLLPATALLVFLPMPIVELLFERGAFGDTATRTVAPALAAMSIGLVFNGGVLLLMRAFFSLQQFAFPVAAGIVNVAVNALAALALHEQYGLAGIALATSAANLVVFVLMFALLHRRAGGLHTGRLTGTFAALAALAALSGAAGRLVFDASTALPPVVALALAALACYGSFLAIVSAAAATFRGAGRSPAG